MSSSPGLQRVVAWSLKLCVWFLPKEKGWGSYAWETHEETNKQSEVQPHVEAKLNDYPLVSFSCYRMVLYLSHSSHGNLFSNPIWNNYISLTHHVFLVDKHEANFMKNNLSETANKFIILHNSHFTLYGGYFFFVCVTTNLTSSSYNKGNCHLSLCLYEIFLEVACQLQPEL